MPFPRVLHVLTHHAPDARGGIETYVARLLAAQRARGTQAMVLCTSPQAERDPAVFTVPKVFPIHQVLDRAEPTPLRDAIAAAACDLLHVHHWHQLGDEIVATAHAHGIPAVVTLHDFYTSCPRFFRHRDGSLCAPATPYATCVQCVAAAAAADPLLVQERLQLHATRMLAELRAAQRILALSRAQLEYLMQIPELHGLAIDVVDLPPPWEATPATAPPARTPHAPFRLVTWGGLVRPKGLGTLRDACRALPVPVELHHYGDRIDEQLAADLLGDPSVPVILHGPQDLAQMRATLAGYDLAVFPSSYLETYGFAVDEAMQTGLPVLVSDRGALRERIGTRGVTFRADDVADLAQVLAQVLDPRRLAELRAGTPAFRTTLAAHVDALASIYRDAIARFNGTTAARRRSPPR